MQPMMIFFFFTESLLDRSGLVYAHYSAIRALFAILFTLPASRAEPPGRESRRDGAQVSKHLVA